MKASDKESIKNAIIKALDKNDTDSAFELIDYWDTKFPLEEEGRCLFYYFKLLILLKCHELTTDSNAKVEYLGKAIETGNMLFAANEEEGFPMDSEVEKMWFELVDLSAQLVAFYSEGIYDDDEDEEDESIDSYEEDQTDLLTEAIYARIGTINRPNLKPKPPRKYDDSLKSKLLKAVDQHLTKFDDLDSNELDLLENICEVLNLNFEDFFNSIYDY